MKFYQKIAVAIVIIIFVYILWKLLKRRDALLRQFGGSYEPFSLFGKEGFQTQPILISNITPKYASKPLREFVIKSSYNTAVSGNNVSTDTIKNVLARGCRFLDFEIFYINNSAHVAYSTDETNQTIDSDNSILLDEVFSTIISNAFASPTPNVGDPLFLHLRIKSTHPEIYKEIAKSIDYALRPKLYPNPVTKETKLADIMGKIVVVFDKTSDRDYKTHSKCDPSEKDCINLAPFINMESGSETLYLQHYGELLNQCTSPPMVLDNCDLCTNVKTMRIVLPDANYVNTENPEIDEFILNYGSQIVPYRFYKNDAGLKDYESFFDENNAAFVPLATAIHNIHKVM
uniref:Phosphatidylinositol-specific phospholipase C X domain-containing protein n=1 Tax=viral metagenome TaxID=1070528 RepID=A0A6C0DMJ2_9ZZZZ